MSGPQMISAPVLKGPLPVVMCIGDSLTEFASQPNGWGSLLQNHYVSRRDVLLRGMSGYNSRWLSRCLKDILPLPPTKQQQPEPSNQQNIAVLTLLVGTNDAVNPAAKSGPGWPQQHVPVEEYEDHMHAMVNHLVNFRNADNTKPTIVIMSPPPQDGEDWHKFMMMILGGTNTNNGNADGEKSDNSAESTTTNVTEQKTDEAMPKQRSCEAVRPYAEATERVVQDAKALLGQSANGGDDEDTSNGSQSNRIVFIDLYNVMLADTEGWRRFLSEDGVHLSQDGNKFLFERISEALKDIEGSADVMPRHAPHFLDVDSAFAK